MAQHPNALGIVRDTIARQHQTAEFRSAFRSVLSDIAKLEQIKALDPKKFRSRTMLWEAIEEILEGEYVQETNAPS